MIPYKDDNPTERFPYLTIALIGINILVFLIQITYPVRLERIVYSYGAIPRALLTFREVQPIHPLLTIFTSMFMHGSILHLASNMLYLWIFGNNIEDQLGYGKFILFYLLCGVAAAYSHALTNPSSTTPMIGASGAISGILGAYLLLFPRARVHTVIFLGFFIQVVRLPAVVVIGFWIVLQFINGMVTASQVSHGGVAWFAHIGGFLVGIFCIKIFLGRKKRHLYR